MATKKTFLTIDDYRASGLYKDEANDPALEKLLMIASQKIDMVANLGLDAFDSPNMTQDQQDALKEATSIVVDHWNSGGWDWKRSSGSASISSLSASISRMDNNDIVPQIALDILQRASLYDPFETIDMCDAEDAHYVGGGGAVNPNQGFTQAQLNYLINNFVPSYGLSGKQDMLPISPGGTNTKDYLYVNKHGHITIELLTDLLTRNGYSKGGGTSTGSVSADIPWLTDHYSGVSNFANTAKNYEMVKYNIDKTGTNNPDGFLILVKTPGGIREIRTWEEIVKLVDSVKADITKNADDIAQLASEIQYIENTWTGDRLLPSNGTSDLSALQGDKGAFDFTAGKKLIITVGAMGKAITDTKVLKVGTSGSYHLVGEGVDATFGVTVSDSGVLTIQNFASTGSTSIDMHDLLIKSIEQNPPVASTGGGVIQEHVSAKELGDFIVDNTLIQNVQTKVPNAVTMVDIIRNQQTIDSGFLSEFSDNVYFMNDTTMEYRDANLNLITLDAAITTTLGNPVSVAYSSLISPYDRISQDQASFDATMYQDGMKIQYLFTSKGKAVRFSGNTNSHYKWETVTKFGDDYTEKYIRFTGDAVLEVNDSALSPTGTWVGHNMPYEIPLTDLMDSANRTAIVTMNFTTKPTAGSKVASIDYKTAAHFYAQREEALFKAQAKENDEKYAHKLHEYNIASFTHQTGYLIGDKPSDFDTLEDGTLIKLDLSKIDAYLTPPRKRQMIPAPTIGAGDGLFIGVDYAVRIPNTAGSAALKWETKTNPTDSNVKDNYKANDLVVEMHFNQDGSKQLNFVRWDKKALGGGAQLTKTLTVVFTDGTQEDFKVG